ncbi:MAG: sigma-70 family RNA polymerase sigma factor [Candidatus Omnitrophica bacterium]|nr:sigma-70 family RNA polymerase sigma factor [Candidatus Omnitrophota bacterium]
MNLNFETLVNRITPTLKRITHRLNGHFTFFDDDDLYQEAVTYLWPLFQRGRLGDKTDSYILQGCYFHLKNYIRTSMDKAKLISIYKIIDADETELGAVLAAKETPDPENLEYKILLKESDRMGLTEKERRVISYSLEGLTTREIGDRLGVSHVMVLKIKGKIKHKLRIFRNEYRRGYQN